MKARSARYASHIVRGNNEGIVRGALLREIKQNQVVIVMDWKMKWLVSFFSRGTSAIFWQGWHSMARGYYVYDE